MYDQELVRDGVKVPEKNGVSCKDQYTLVNIQDCRNRACKRKTKLTKIILGLITLVVISVLGGYIIGKLKPNDRKVTAPLIDPIDPRPPSPSWLKIFKKAAVCTDAARCSDVGRYILSINGSAVDAAIASMFCSGLLNMASMGIGGGFFMTVYIKEERKVYTVIAREKAPGTATQDMFNGSYEKSSKGGLAVAVPGDVRGMWAAHRRWGKLPWDQLVKPTLQFCKYGLTLLPVTYVRLFRNSRILNDVHLRKMYFDSEKNEFYKPGTLVKPSEALCNTLKTIAQEGGDALYNGSLATVFLEDLHRAGSIITAKDLENYQPKITEPLSIPLSDGDTLYTPPPPSSGAILVNILNILSGYNFTNESIIGTENKILTYHRIIEAFKYAYAARTKLGDKDFLDLDEFVRKITSQEYATEIRLKINDAITNNSTAYYGASEYQKPDYGTAHMSIIAENGDAVALTSSINNNFGAGFSTLKTGVVMNNVMDDFSSPGITNYYGLEPSPANFIAPGKRPQSTMSPTIIIDRNGNVKLVIGASGGTKIATSTALVAMRKLWFGQTIKEAVDEPRIHHQIFPMAIQYEYGVTKDIVEGLRNKGHGMKRYTGRGSSVCALYRDQTAIYGNADFRKGGEVSGMD